MVKRIFIVVFILFAGLLLIGARIEHGKIMINNNPIVNWIYDHTKKTVTTEGKNLQWMKDAFTKHIKILILKGGKVNVESDSFFMIRTAFGESSSKFFLNISDVFYGPPDHHAWMKFKLLKIFTDGVDISYENGFNHSSFGKNLITIDRGVVHLHWKTAAP